MASAAAQAGRGRRFETLTGRDDLQPAAKPDGAAGFLNALKLRWGRTI